MLEVIQIIGKFTLEVVNSYVTTISQEFIQPIILNRTVSPKSWGGGLLFIVLFAKTECYV